MQSQKWGNDIPYSILLAEIYGKPTDGIFYSSSRSHRNTFMMICIISLCIIQFSHIETDRADLKE